MANDGGHCANSSPTFTQEESQTSAWLEFTRAALDFLKLAVPALTQYQDSPGQCPTPQVPETIAQSELWEFFLKQRDQIPTDKWIQPRNAGYDVGMQRAIRDWLRRTRTSGPSPRTTPRPHHPSRRPRSRKRQFAPTTSQRLTLPRFFFKPRA
jgi:hypothetical protein